MESKDKEYIRIDYYKNPNNEIIVSNIRMHNKRIVLQKLKSGNIKMIIANVCDQPNKPIVAQQVIHSIVRYTEQQFSPEAMLAISNCYMVMSGIDKFEEVVTYQEHDKNNESTAVKQDVVCDVCGHEWNTQLEPNQITEVCPNCKQLAYFDYDE